MSEEERIERIAKCDDCRHNMIIGKEWTSVEWDGIIIAPGYCVRGCVLTEKRLREVDVISFPSWCPLELAPPKDCPFYHPFNPKRCEGCCIRKSCKENPYLSEEKEGE